MKATIKLPSGAVIEVDASAEEIRRLAGEPGYRLTMYPAPAAAPMPSLRFVFSDRPITWAAPALAAAAAQAWSQAVVLG